MAYHDVAMYSDGRWTALARSMKREEQPQSLY